MDEYKIKKIRIKTAEGKEYMLAYDRKSCARISRKGFKIDDIKDAPAVAFPLLISGAFMKFHPELSQDEIEKIWAQVSNKQDLLRELVEMYAEPLNSLFAEPENGEKNSTWEVVE